jgi:hypothetical protein
MDQFPDIVSRVQGADFDSVLAVAVFRGKSVDGHISVSIQKLTTGPGTAQLTVEIREPLVSAGYWSYPCHIILIPRERLPSLDRGTTWMVQTADGRLLAETTYP